MPKISRWFSLFLALGAYSVVLSVVLVLLIEFEVIHLGFMTYVIVFQTLAFGVPFLGYCWRTKKPIGEILPFRRLDAKNLGLVVGITLCMMPIMATLSALSTLWAPNYVAEVLEDATFTYPFLLTLFAVGVMPSVLEELVFRGVFVAETRHFSLHRMAILNGVMFGLIHMNLQQLLYTFVLGVLFCYLLHYTGNILVPIISHFIINGLNISMVYAITATEALTEYTPYPPAEYEDISIWMIVGVMAAISLVFTPLLVFLFKVLIARNKPAQIAPSLEI